MAGKVSTKCRLLFVIDDMGVGGAQKQVAEVVNRLDGCAFVSDIVCITEGGVNLERAHGAREAYVLGASKVYDVRGMAAAARLAGIVRQGKYHVLEAYLPAAHLVGALALAGSRRTALVAARRHVADLDPAWMATAKPLLNRATWLSIANSQAVKRSIVERYGLPPSKVVVVPNFVLVADGASRREDVRRRLGLADADFAVAAAGTFCPVKDYPTILKAFAGLVGAGRRAVLVVAGDGKGRGGVAALAERLGLNGQVRFLGAVGDVREVLRASDAFVHASVSEGMSNAILEAMAEGLPVVASDIPANRETLGESGARFFAPGDARGCLEGLEAFADDRAAAALAGQRCRERARRAFGSDRTVRRRERIYRRIAGVIDGKTKA